jgi:hypothetical protein
MGAAVLKLDPELRSGMGAGIGAVGCILDPKLRSGMGAIVGAVAGPIGSESDP